MKNFPNQAIDVARIRETLAIIGDLHERGLDTADDGVLGYALAERGAYTFRHLDRDVSDYEARLRDRIVLEKQKPGGSQGARTNAREMRRTLIALGWVGHDGAHTPEGAAMLSSPPGSQDERLLLAEALLDLVATDREGHSSHPVRVLLALLGYAPSRHREGLELALEALDDSPSEWVRVRTLYELTPQERQAQLGVSSFQINNARKIFPSLARAAGLVVEDEHGIWTLSSDGSAVVADGTLEPRSVLARVARQRQRSSRVVTAETVARDMGGLPRRPLTDDEQARAAQLLNERTSRHQALVQQLLRSISTPGEFQEDRLSFDLLWIRHDESAPILLFEVKTIDSDASEQCRRAVSQLGWYHYFDVSPRWPERAVREVVVFDRPIDSSYVAYLDSRDISSLCLSEADGLVALSELGADLPALLAASPL